METENIKGAGRFFSFSGDGGGGVGGMGQDSQQALVAMLEKEPLAEHSVAECV